MAIDYKNSLNLKQQEVVFSGDGYSLVLAGAGSGKTRTIVYRVAYLLEEKKAAPEEILLVTFTIKAAKEMLSRVEALLGRGVTGIWGGTFHHICNRILRKFAPKLGLAKNYIIVDDEDSKALFAQCIRDVNEKSIKGFPSAGFFSYLRGLSLNTMRNWQEILVSQFEEFADLFYLIKEVFSLYEVRKKEADLVDFDDLLFLTYKLLLEDEKVRNYYANRFKYILVDEYQDTSRLQARIVDLLSSVHKNLLVVGDDAQSIYSFRGATVDNILEFPQRYPDVNVFYLEENYRSTPEVLYLANSAICNNLRGFQKQLKAMLSAQGEVPIVAKFSSPEEEARFISEQIDLFIQEGIPPSNIAVLFRASYQSAKLELSLAHRGIDYIMRGGLRFFEQAHIKDVLSYLRVLYNPKDWIAWQRLLCMYPGIGPQTAKKLFVFLQEMDFSTTTEKRIKGVSEKAKKAIGKIEQIFSDIKDLCLYDAVRVILDSGYWDYLRENFEDYAQRQEDLIYLLDFLKGYKDLGSLFSDIGITENFKKDLTGTADAIILSTIHQAKGLEWDVVFVMGVVDGQFPHSKSLKEDSGLEEERRLFYVAITRAKKYLLITSPTMGFDYRYGGYFIRRSTFIEELPRDGYKEYNKAVYL